MKDFRDEQVRREYPNGLDEMQETMEFMTGLAGGYALKGNVPAPVEREQNAEYAATQEEIEPVVTDFDVPHVDNMIVEEDPLDFEPAAAVEEDVEVDASIFRAYDIRGVVNRTLTEGVVKLIGRAIGSEAHARGLSTVAVARDGRLSGPGFLAALSRGPSTLRLSASGIGSRVNCPHWPQRQAIA